MKQNGARIKKNTIYEYILFIIFDFILTSHLIFRENIAATRRNAQIIGQTMRPSQNNLDSAAFNFLPAFF